MEITMNTNYEQESARIYQFPAGGRAALGGKRYEQFTRADVQTLPRVNEAVCSGSWYHEEAIRESEGARDH
jgi:Protein of unknown function (DUF2735)